MNLRILLLSICNALYTLAKWYFRIGCSCRKCGNTDIPAQTGKPCSISKYPFVSPSPFDPEGTIEHEM
ncbi:hypothetical protein C8R41DRAFT_854909, partial [Lentinula lateritia]